MRKLALIALLALGACANGQPAPTSQLVTDAQTLAAGVKALVVDVAAIPNSGIPAATLVQIEAECDTVSNDAAAVAAASQAQLPTTVAALEADLPVLSAMLTPVFPAAPAVAVAVQAAVTLGTTIAQEAGATGASTVAPTMTPDAARLILRAHASRA